VRDSKAELVPIKIGRDFGSSVEVTAGLDPTDQVILNPADSLVSGTPVRINSRAAVGSAR
jgi:multidrug efflux pump subunit AcrA (membrane-fusion protein)